MSGQNIAEKIKKSTHFICMTNIFYVISITYMQARRR
jgi:hypothetical protein